VVFLGTSSAVPVANRSFPSIAVLRKDEVIIVDCGEGAQRQMVIAGIGFCRRMKILITHLHGDHIGGLTGLMQTMSMLKRSRALDIYGPKGVKGFINSTIKYLKVKLQYPVNILEVKEGLIVKEKEYEIYAKKGLHPINEYCYLFKELPRPGRFNVQKAKSLGIPEGPLWHRIQSGEKVALDEKIIRPEAILGPSRPGRVLGFSGDTRPHSSLSKFFKNADLLVFESTYSDRDADKAAQNMHSTSSDAAKIAFGANVKMLALVHLSARYEDSSSLLSEALKHYKNVIIPEDLDVIEVPYPDSKEPLKIYHL
jgi:ribonuclease Z